MKTKELNKEIRAKAKAKNVRNYEIAQGLHISLYTFQHWLMQELSPERKKAVLKVIDEISFANKNK